MKYQKILALLILISLMSSCYKDEIMTTETIDIISAERVYLNTINGHVLDTLGDPISSAIIEMGSETTITDEDGYFEIVDIMIPSSGAFLAVTHPIHYDGGIRIYATAPITQTVQISLVPRGVTQNFSNAQGATLKVANLAEVTIPSEAFMNKGQVHEGMVTLEVYLVNPKEAQSFNKRIQVFEACECSSASLGGEEILKSELNSIMYIKAYDDNGEKLTVAPDKIVKVQLPTYGSGDMADAKLYSFDDEIGFWKVERDAERNGDSYNVELDHFSWWGVGVAKAAEDLCLTFTNVTPNDDHFFIVSSADGRTIHLGTVNYDVETCFPAALSEDVEIKVFSYCLIDIFGASVMTNASGKTEVTVDVESKEADGYLVEIEVVDCDMNPLQDTVTVFYSTDSNTEFIDSGVGTFDLLLDECFQSDELYIIVNLDDGNTEYAFSEQVEINMAQRQYNIRVVACQDVMPIGGHLTINGITYSEVIARKNPQETLIIAKDGNKEVIIGFDGFGIGTFNGRVISFQNNVFCEGIVNVSAYGDVKEYVEGSFEIPSDESVGCESINGEFKAIREQ